MTMHRKLSTASLAAAGMAFALWAMLQLLSPFTDVSRPALVKAAALGFMCCGGLAVYAALGQILRGFDLFALALVVQSLPFLASVALAVLEGSRVNDFAFWHGLEGRIGQMLTRRPVVPAAPAPAPVAEKQIEPAQ